MPAPTVHGIDRVEKEATIECPECERYGTIDWDQLNGKVSIVCDCGYHETHDLTDQIPYR